MLIPWDVIGTKKPEKKAELWERKTYQARVEALTEDTHSDGRKILVARSRVVAPDDAKGQSIFDKFWVGTKDDNDALDPDTWASNFAAVRFQEFIGCFDIEPSSDSEVLGAQIKDREFLPKVKPRHYTRSDGKPGCAADVEGYYKLGAQAVGTANGKAGEATTTTQTAEPVRYAEVPE
jgi:hypothetical protein